MTNKILIIRFSSFGDIVQTMSVLPSLINKNYEIHWLVRDDMSSILRLSKGISKIWSLNRSSNLLSLIKLAFKLRGEKFTHIYDAHSSLRSIIACWVLRLFNNVLFIRRSKNRIKRFLLFKFRLNYLPQPFKGIYSYIEPLKPWIDASNIVLKQIWSFENLISQERLNFLNQFKDKIVCVPSAAWEMKRWPVDYWKKLIQLNSNKEFVILGGEEDLFCNDIASYSNSKNLAGELSLVESCYVVSVARKVISADTGLIHVADVLGVSGISIIGPTAFGFCSNDNIKTLNMNLDCSPCTKDGRGKCHQKIYKKCLVDISPERVSSYLV